MQKKSINSIKREAWIFAFVISVSLLVFIPSLGHAQAPVEPQDLESLTAISLGETISLSNFGFDSRSLQGPFAATQYIFGLPGEWELLGANSEIQLDLNISVIGGDGIESIGHVGLLEVVFNGISIGVLRLEESGDVSYVIPIPAEALAPSLSSSRHNLVIQLVNEEVCLYDIQTVVVIKDTSRVILPHGVKPLVKDLSLFPYPIYQPDSFVPTAVTIVIPDAPSLNELRAGIITAATIGKLTGGGVIFKFTTSERITLDEINYSHLVLVGKPNGLPLLNQLALPRGLTSAGFDEAGIAQDDGILQMVDSPWNSGRVVLVIGGNSDSAVLKAAQALSTGEVFGVKRADLAEISKVNSQSGIRQELEISQTLNDLGYGTDTVKRSGLSRREFQFFVPFGKTIEGDTYIDLVYSHAGTINTESSGLVVTLNGTPIGSTAFFNSTTDNNSERYPIPKSLIKAGVNQFSVEVTLRPNDVCADIYQENLWFSIFSDSQIHLPLRESPTSITSRGVDLTQFPGLFDYGPSLGGAAFILSESAANEWQSAGDLAYFLGSNQDWSLMDLEVAFSNAIPENIYSQRDMIVIGRPSSHPIISSLVENLPVPFASGTDNPIEDNLNVVYRLPEGANLGYVELLPSPWNLNAVILMVLGNTEIGLDWAANSLEDPILRSQLNGNFALINGTSISSGYISPQGSAGPLFSTTTLPGETFEQAPISFDNIETAKPIWIIPAVLLISILIIAVLFIVFGSSVVRFIRRYR